MLLNNGDGTFSAPVDYVQPVGIPIGFQLVDVDGDWILDSVMAVNDVFSQSPPGKGTGRLFWRVTGT